MKKAFLLLLVCVCVCSVPYAQTVTLGPNITMPCDSTCVTMTATVTGITGSTNNYTIDSTVITYPSPYAYTIAGSTNIIYADDYYSSAITLPFTFCFYGNSYTQLVIGTNADIVFDPTLAGLPSDIWDVSLYGPIPSATYNTPAIHVCQGDWETNATHPTSYIVQGTAPNRVFIVNFKPHEFNCTGLDVTFQAVLHETSNIIDFYFQDRPICAGWNSGESISGLQKNGTTALALPGKNATAWGGTGINKAYRFIPSGSPSVSLLTSGGTVLQTITPASSGSGTFTATFNPVCPAVSPTSYIAQATGTGCGTVSATCTVTVTSGTIPTTPVTAPVTYCQNAPAAALTATLTGTGTSLLWYTVATGGTGSATAPTPSTSAAGSTTYYVSETTGLCESPRVPLVVTILPTPATPVASNTGPVCVGSPVTVSSTLAPGDNYIWTGPAGFTATTQNFTIPSGTATMSGTYCVRDSAGGCASLQGCTTISIQPIPLINTITANNPTFCYGNNGTMVVGVFVPGTVYHVRYVSLPTVVVYTLTLTADASGNLTIPGLVAGGYDSVSVTSSAGCAGYSHVFENLVNPPTPNISGTSSANPTTCGGSDGTITLNGLVTGTAYVVSYTLASVVYTVAITGTAPGQVVISGLAAGSYSALSVNPGGGCVSNTIAGPIVLSNPANPVISSTAFTNPTCAFNDGTITLNGLAATTTYTVHYILSGVPLTATLTSNGTGQVVIAGLSAGTYSSIYVTAPTSCNSAVVVPITLVAPPVPVISSAPTSNPTTCLGTDGSITLNGLTPSATYTVNYTVGGVPQSATYTTNAAGQLIMGALAAGVYNSINVTGTGTCQSANTGPLVLSDPAPPATPVAGSNSPVCSGNTILLTATDVTPGALTYSWSGPNLFTAAIANPSITGATAVNSGTYSVTATLNNCASAVGTVAVVVNPTPVITGSSSTDPTVCAGTDGTITLTGLTALVSYTVNYTVGVTVHTVTIIADASGNVVITGIGAGTYSAISVTSLACGSNTAGPITLSDPTPPATPTLTSNSPICSGGNIIFTATETTPGTATYSWSGPLLYSSTLQNPTITGAPTGAGGNYLVTATIAGCTSAAAIITVVVNTTPTITATETNPTTCLGTNGTITISGLTPLQVYAINYTAPGGTAGTTTAAASAAGTVTISGLSAGSYTGITATSPASCISNTISITLSDPVPPVTPTPTSNSPICSGATLDLFDIVSSTAVYTYNWTGPNLFTSTLHNPTIPGATTLASGVYTLTVTQNNCTSAPGMVTVVVNLTPTITATFTNPSVCGGTDGTITISGATASGAYTVSYTKGATVVNTTLTSSPTGQLVITGLSAATYSAITISASGCPSNTLGPLTLTDPLAPAIPVITTNSPVCVNGTITFSATDATAGVSWSWTGPGFAAPATAATATITPATTADAGTYTLTVSQASCSSSATTVVVVNPLPAVPTASSNTPVCTGYPLILTATSTAGTTYSWAGPSSFTATTTSTTETIASAALTSAGIYTVTATLNGCAATATATTNVTVNPTPAAPTTTDQGYCQFATPVALAATGTSLLWYTTPTGGTGSTTDPVPSTATTGIFTWYVTQSSALGCESPRAPLNVVVTAKPAAPVVTTPVGYCQFDVASALTATGTTLEWYGPAYTAGYSVAPTPSTATPATYIYYVTQSVSGCQGDSAMITVNVTVKPAPPVTVNVDYCQGTIASQLTATGSSLEWYSAAGGAGTAVAPVPVTTVPGITTWYVSQTVNGCTSTLASLLVTVHEAPVFTIVGGKSYDCQYDTLSLSYSGTPDPGAIYTWTLPTYASITSGAGTSAIVAVFDTSLGSNLVSLTVGDGYAPCNVTETYTVAVYDAPLAEFYMKPDVCIGDTMVVALTYTGPGVADYAWNFGTADVIVSSADHSGPYKIVWPATGTYNVTLTAISAQNCPSKVVTDTTDVHPYPDAQIAQPTLLHGATSVCTGDSVQLQPLNYTEGYYYAWSPQHYFNQNNYRVIYGTIDVPGYVKLTVTNSFGCAATDSVFINAQTCCNVEFPDAFTPNGDTHNDYFRPIMIGHHAVHNFRIANRWGQTVFESASQDGQWDGTFNGIPQDMGLYFYYFSYDCNGNTLTTKGEVNLIR